MPLTVKADGLEKLSQLSDKWTAAGLKDLVLDPDSRTLRKASKTKSLSGGALNQKNRSLGFPTITFPCEMTKRPLEGNAHPLRPCGQICRHHFLSDFQGESLFPLLVERLNIYTDPQAAMMMQQAIYPLKPDGRVPGHDHHQLLLSLTSSSQGRSKRAAFQLAPGHGYGRALRSHRLGGRKIRGDAIGGFVKKSGITDKVKHRRIVIPGAVAAVSGDLEEELGKDWEVQDGPREAAIFPPF